MKEFVLSLNTVLAAMGAPLEDPNRNVSVEFSSPIVGLWEIDIPKELRVGNCTERYNFQANDKFSVISNKEWTSGKYVIVEKKDKKLPILIIKTKYDDNNVDCSGKQEDQTGQVFPSYLNITSDATFELCADSDGKECFLKFHKILP